MIRHLITLFLILFFVPSFSQILHEVKDLPGLPGTVEYNTAKLSDPAVQPLNGNGTLGQTYNVTKCGLNYTSANQKLGQRFSPAGVAQPAPFAISGIPACAVIERAYLYVTTSGNGIAVTATVTNPASVTNNYPMTIIGSGADKCWGYAGSYSYRADVTTNITGNGTYMISGIPTGATNDADGAALIIIYSDPTANYQGTMIIHDGIIVVGGGTATSVINGFNACANSSAASGFLIVGDLQMAPTSLTINGGAATTTWNWFNYVQMNTSVSAGQTTSNYGVSSSGDCFSFIAEGLYFQTTTCTTCPSGGGLTATTSQTNVSCNGGSNGSASISVSGGSGSYTYSWSPSGGTGATASGLSAGTYTVTVTDGGCNTISRTFTITQPPAITATMTSTNVSCNGGTNGTATVTPGGGASPFTFSWAPSGGTGSTASNLAAGTYTVTVTDAGGCTVTRTATITQPPALTTTGSQINVSCNGGSNGSASVVASGGTAAYTYSWSPSGGTGATASGLSAGNYTVTVTDANGCTTTRTYTITQPTLLTSTGSQTNVSCNAGSDGTATVTPSGGTGAYTYSWSPSGGSAATATGLSAGTYSVTVTDANGCTITRTYTITQPTALSATQSQVNVSCSTASDGSATVNVSGGTLPYTYSWSPSGGNATTASGLSAGNYTVTITDAKGCQITSSFTIIAAPSITIVQSQTNVSCNGGSNGSAAVAVSGGTSPYTYSWTTGGTTNSITGLTAGSYSVSITDGNGCSVISSFTITQPPSLSISQTQTNVSCNGGSNGSATATVTGGTGAYTYSWSPSGGTGVTASGLSAGTYVVTVTDALGCTATSSYVISQPSVLSATGTQSNVSCNGGSDGSATVTVAGGTTSYTYSWSPSGGTAATASALTAGTYLVNITDANGCTTSQSFTITEPTALSIVQSQTNVTCNGGSNGAASVTVSGGTPGYTYSWSSGGNASSVSALSAGAYTVTVIDAEGCTTTANFTITEPPAFSVTPSNLNVSCNGGSNGQASVVVGGATPAYTYSWSPSGGTSSVATGLSAGTYVVTITDNVGCSTSSSITVTEPPALSVTQTQTNVSCNGGSDGSATVTVSGGTGTYTYSWSSSASTTSTASGLSAGTYTATITDANGCVITSTFTITQSGTLSASHTKTDVTCFGGADGSAVVTASGGTGVLTYSWSPSGGNSSTASGLSAGAYVITITDQNGCSLNENVMIGEPPVLAVTSTQTNVLCNGNNTGAAVVSVTGGTGSYTYSWSPSVSTGNSASNLSAGTYTVSVTDANGCVTTNSITITEPPALTTTQSQVNADCFGASTGSATITPSGGVPSYTYSWSPVAGTTGTINSLSAGTYNVMVTDANGCSVNATFNITEPVELTSTQTQVDVLCNGGATGSATIIPAGGTGSYTYSWTPSSSTTSTATGLSAGSHSVIVSDANGCSITRSFTITEPPVLAVTSSQVNVDCNGASTGIASVVPSGGNDPYSYSWTPNVSTSDSALNLAAGNYSVMITDSNGCTINQSFTITEPPVLSITQSQVDVNCFGYSTGSATVSVSGGSGSYSYTWTPNVSNTSTASNLAAGSYSVQVSDTNNCTISASFVITEPAGMTTVQSQVDLTCNGNSTGSAAVTVSGGSGTYTYSWNPNVSSTDSASNLAAGTYIVTIADSSGCTVSDTFNIAEPDVLSVTKSSTNVLCNDDSTGTATITPAGGTAPYTFSWTPLVSTGATASGLPVGTYNVLVTDSNGCTIADSVIISQPDVLSISVSTTGTTCSLANGSATATVTGGTTAYTYSWDTSPSQTTATASSIAAGNYVLTVTDANGCIDTANVSITDEPAPVSTISASDNVTCNGDSDGSATVSFTGGTSPVSIAWNTSPAQSNATASGLAAGTYEVIITDANNCTDTSTVTISEPAPLIVSLTADNIMICNGSSATLNTSVTGGNGTQFTYTWNNSLSDTSTHSVSPVNETIYSVSVTDTAGCVSPPATITIDVYEALQGSIIISDQSICIGEEVSVTVNMTGGSGAYSYSWNTGEATQTIVDSPGSDSDYQVVVTDLCGTMSFDEDVNVNMLPEINAGRDTTIVIGNSANLSAAPGLTYSWSPAITLDDPSSSNPVATPEETTLYTVVATDQNGCTSSDSVRVIVEIKNDVFVPSGFSPNGDGENDVLYVRGTSIRTVSFLVFDRWGHKVFEGVDKSQGWDGTVKGTQMNTAVFVYYVEVTFMDGETRTLKGDVTLIR